MACGLQKSSYLDHITSKLKSSVGKHHDTYWSIPKSPLHAMTFLHFFASGNMAGSQSRIFSHFSFHLRPYATSYHSQSNHLGPFNIRHKHWLHKRLWLTCRLWETLWALYFHLLIWAWRILRNHWSFLIDTSVHHTGRILCCSGHLGNLNTWPQATSK